MAAPMNILTLIEIEAKYNKRRGVQVPEPRSGHRIIADNYNFYSIGGYNPDFWEAENDENTYYPLFRELWKFNFASRKWVKLKTSGYMPVELASHSATKVDGNLLVFGGTGIPFGEAASNQVYICNLSRLEWTHICCTGDAPTRGYGHSLTLLGSDLYVFGGTTGWEYNGDLHKLDLPSGEWLQLEPVNGKTPAGRYRHEAACDGQRLYIFGGGRATKVYPFKKIPVYTFKVNRWEKFQTNPDPVHDTPEDRRCHTCVQYKNDAYICGGYNGDIIYRDIWKIDLRTLTWTKLNAEMPLPAYFHSAAVTPNGRMYIFGGVTQIDNLRTSNIYAMWLTVPSLRDLCWDSITRHIPDIDMVPKHTLLEAGVPQDLANSVES